MHSISLLATAQSVSPENTLACVNMSSLHLVSPLPQHAHSSPSGQLESTSMSVYYNPGNAEEAAKTTGKVLVDAKVCPSQLAGLCFP